MEQHQKKIAIVLPVYNMEEFLSECIDSILSQTYTNFDIFAVDDASTDSSLEILYRYQKKDSRIVILKRENNGGLSAARNTALDEIEKRQTYDYISFCDSDDIIVTDMLEELVAAAIREHADVASCCFDRIDFQEKDFDRFSTFCSFSPELFVEQIFSLGRWRRVRGNGGYVWLRLFSAPKIKGIRFLSEKTLSEDELFCMTVATKVSKITHIPKNLYHYRLRPGSLSNSKTFRRKLLQSRVESLPLSKQISHYATLVNACAIARLSKNNMDCISSKTALQILPQLKLGKQINLISRKEYWRFFFFVYKHKIFKSMFNRQNEG